MKSEQEKEDYIIKSISWLCNNPSYSTSFHIDFDLHEFRISDIGSTDGRKIISKIIKDQPFTGWILSTDNIDHVFHSFVLRGKMLLKRKV